MPASPSSPSPLRLEAGAVVAERYELLEPIGSGGMGEVWLVRHRELEVEMALKLLGAELAGDAVARERFRREARITAGLTSAHALVVHDHGEHAGQLFVVTERLHGETLKRRLEREGCLAPRDVLRLAREIGDALAEGHGLGVVHRDIKPSNVFLARGAGRERAKLLDFGVASAPGAPDATLTEPGRVVGSPRYMSPEQALGEAATAASDLYSLAIVVYEMLFGVAPYGAVRQAHRVADMLARKFTRPSTLLGVACPDLDAFFARAFDREPEGRPGSVALFLDGLGCALAGMADEPPVPREDATRTAGAARPSPPSPRPRWALGRVPLAFAAGALVAALASRWPTATAPEPDVASARSSALAEESVATPPPLAPAESAEPETLPAPQPSTRPPSRSLPAPAPPAAASLAAPQPSRRDPFSGIEVDPE